MQLYRERAFIAKGQILVGGLKLRIDQGESSRHMAPVQNRDQLALQPRNKCYLMKTDQHLEHLNTRTVLKLA